LRAASATISPLTLITMAARAPERRLIPPSCPLCPRRPGGPGPPGARRRKGNGDTYRRVIYGLSLAFGLVMASLMWRVDGYFGVAFLQRVPGLTTLPNTVLWPPCGHG
jgi:hypothetical protein